MSVPKRPAEVPKLPSQKAKEALDKLKTELEKQTLLTTEEKDNFFNLLEAGSLSHEQKRRYAEYYTNQFQIYDKAADKATLKKNLKTVVGLLKKLFEIKKIKTQGNAKGQKKKKWRDTFDELLQIDINNSKDFDPKLKELNKIKITWRDGASDLRDLLGNIFGRLRFT